MITKIRELDGAIATFQQRIVAIQEQEIAPRQRERDALYNALSPEEKAELHPAPADDAAPVAEPSPDTTAAEES